MSDKKPSAAAIEAVQRHAISAWGGAGGETVRGLASAFDAFAASAVKALEKEWKAGIKKAYRELNQTPIEAAEKCWSVINQRTIDDAVAAEKEACANILERMVVGGRMWTEGQEIAAKALLSGVEAIRARGAK